MSTLQLIGKGKLNQKATALLLAEIERLRALDLEKIGVNASWNSMSQRTTPNGFSLISEVTKNAPYQGCFRFEVRIEKDGQTIVETAFFRSE